MNKSPNTEHRKRGFKAVRLFCAAVLVTIGMTLTTGCVYSPLGARLPVHPPSGFIFQETYAPLALEKNELRQADGSNLKEGSAVASQFVVPFTYNLLSFGWGDASLETSTKDGRINEIHHADVREFTILGIYTETEVIARGS